MFSIRLYDNRVYGIRINTLKCHVIPSVSLKDPIISYVSFKAPKNVIHFDSIELISYTLSPFDDNEENVCFYETAKSSVMKRCYRI